MSKNKFQRLLRPETLTSIGIVLMSAGLLIPTIAMRPLSALLPAVMLIALIILAAAILVSDQRSALSKKSAEAMTKAPVRVFGAFVLIILYALCVDFIGFYPSTAISIPLVTYVFGYRNPKGLIVATLIALSVIYLVFGLAMSQEFPTGRFWS